MATLAKIRKFPNSVREMLEWGMISYNTFKHVCDMTLDEANQYCNNLGLYQTWSYPADAIINHFKEHAIFPEDRTDFVKQVMVITDGQVNPVSVEVAWKFINKGA